MKTKGLLLSLFLLLCSTTAFADKYYKVSYSSSTKYRVANPRPGKKYAIFNTTFNGSADYTGFLYNDGTALRLDKSRDQDVFIYNDCFIFEIVEVDATNKHYAIRSISSGSYVDVDGSTSHSTPQTLRMHTWDEAVAGDTFDKNTTGEAAVGEKNGIKQAFVNSENENYSSIYYNNITSKGNKVFLFSNEDDSEYWGGNASEFLGGQEKGQPFAFYEVYEVTDENKGNLNLEDLHIFSRCDLYSAQQIYGYIKSALQITLQTPDGEKLEVGDDKGDDAIGNLLDGNNMSYMATDWENTKDGHTLLIDLGESINSFMLYMQRRVDELDMLEEYELWVLPDGESEYVKIGDYFETTLTEKENYSKLFKADELGNRTFSKIKIVTKKTSATAKDNCKCVGFSELYVLPNIDVINNAITYFDASLPVRASAKEYNEVLAEYNKNASAVKLLSGVPIPGNKYRIYADAYCDDTNDEVDNPSYVNRHISVGYNEATGEYSLLATEDYHVATGDDVEAFEWYCEESNDGKLMFRNVKYSTMYLASAGVSSDATTWVMNTSLTQRHGVPLKNNAMQYLAVFNTGEEWMGNVLTVQNQTAGSVTIDTNNTPDDATDDVTVAQGLCTDFVFLPVPLKDDEKKITVVTYSPLVDRNTTLTYNGKEYSMPFSLVLTGSETLPEITNLVPTYHPTDGFYTKDSEGNDVNHGEILSTAIGEIESGDTLELRYDIVEPFVKYGADGKYKLYRIINQRKQGVSQQAGPNRSSDFPVVDGDENDQPLSPSQGKSFVAKFDTKSTNMALVEYKDDEFDPKTFFYFEGGDINDQYHSAFIHSAITQFKSKSATEWSEAGQIYFVQPNASDKSFYEGYSISRTILDASNNPSDAWCSNHASGDIVLDHKSNDDGAMWLFEDIYEEKANEALKSYIATLATTLDDTLAAKLGDKDFDDAKIESYRTLVSTKADAAAASSVLNEIVAISQELHMLEHEVNYGLQALPDVSTDGDLANIHWYYARNVYGTDNKGTGVYAAYNGGNNLMKLEEKATAADMTLKNLYHFAGDVMNPGAYNEYLDVHVHNFMAAKDSTLVGRNEVLYENITFTGEDNNISVIQGTDGKKLAKDASWEITVTLTSNGNNNNHWGSCLLATGDSTKANRYDNGFQVYLKTEGHVVVKAGTTTNDYYSFHHTESANSDLKVVISYSDKRLSFTVTNSLGAEQSIKDITGGKDYIDCPNIADITKLSTNIPSGVNITSLKAENVLAMRWDEHNPDQKWYILPSSNEIYTGLAVVMEGADDTNMGWANVSGKSEDIFTALGYGDYSTWKFEKVIQFDDHLAELLEMYGIADCVIYNKNLFGLFKIINENSAVINTIDATASEENAIKEETAFNRIYDAMKVYEGDMANEFKAPKPGKLYTIHHVPETMPGDFKVNDRNVVKVNEDVNTSDGLDSRGVWYFEGTEQQDGFFALNDGALKFKSLHTQSYPYNDGFTANSLTLSDEASAPVTIEAVAGSAVRLKVNGSYLATTGEDIVANAEAQNTGYVETTFNHNNGADVVATSSLYNNLGVVETSFNGKLNDTDITTYKSGGSITSSIICPNGDSANGNASPTIEYTFSYSGLPAGDKYDNVALDIHALNSGGNYQESSDNRTRQWNVQVYDGNDTMLGELVDIDIAKGVNSGGNRHKVWNIALATPAEADASGNLSFKIKVTKGTTNEGCFFGLSSVVLSTKTRDTWYIEEIEKPDEKVYYTVPSLSSSSAANPDNRAYASLYLGFNAKTPAGVDAWIVNGINDINQLQMETVNGIVPAEEGVILTSASPMSNQKFYYSATPSTVDASENRLLGTAYTTLVRCEDDYNIYMLGKKNERIAMYWTYENRNENGEKETIGGTTNHNDSGYVQCNANKSYLMFEEEGNQTEPAMYRFFFDGGTTDIDDITGTDAPANENNSGIYDLQGRKLERVVEPGIYIVNGKKVLVK